ncbi:MAG: glutamyl-tRNA reductase [Thermoflavifilum aggregans]|nr:glutamyl-tRNA reductase [Thermoflavifilum aggregans]
MSQKTHNGKILEHFFCCGINHTISDTSTRSLYAINHSQYQQLLDLAREKHLSELFVLSTCNRTEIYGFAPDAGSLMALVGEVSRGGKDLFAQIAYTYAGEDAVHHLFRVGAGLDSQILGDYEIIGQVKAAARFAKERGFLGSFTERLVNAVIQASKQIKNETALSAGTVSVSFAAVQWLLQTVDDITHKHILLVGAGKIGRSTCKNVIEYLNPAQVTLVNRTNDTAEAFAREHQIHFAPYDQLAVQIRQADIILVATNASCPTLLPSHFADGQPKIVIDLSIPENVHPDVRRFAHVKTVNVDELSRYKDETIQRRQQAVPEALAIIEKHQYDFLCWYRMRRYTEVLRALKHKLEQIHHQEMQHLKENLSYDQLSSRIIQKIIDQIACNLRKKSPQQAEIYLQSLQELLDLPFFPAENFITGFPSSASDQL